MFSNWTTALMHLRSEVIFDQLSLKKYSVGKFSQPLIPAAKIEDVYRIRKTLTQAGGENNYEDTNMVRVTSSGTALPR
jgi:hypothetical protein